MNAKILILGASAENTAFIKKLIDLGLNVVCLDKHPTLDKDFVSQNIKQLTCIECDFINTQAVKDIVVQEHITHTIALPIGRSLVALGKINDYFNFAGPSFDAIDRLTDKVKFHQLCQELALDDAQYIALNDGQNTTLSSQISSIDQALAYPVIVKPSLGSGSLGVRYIATREELLAYQAPERFINSPLLIEQAISGDEYSCNLFVDRHQEIHSMGIFKKEISAIPYRQEIAYFIDDYSCVFDAIQPSIQKIVHKLNISQSFLNADIIMNSQGNHYIIDLSSRLGGNNLLKLLCLTNNNPLEVYYKEVLGNQSANYNKVQEAAALRFFNFEHDIVYGAAHGYTTNQNALSLDSIFSPEERMNIIELENRMVLGQSYGTMKNGSDTKNGYILAKGKDLASANELTCRYLQALAHF